MEKIKTLKRGQALVSAGEYGPVWRITEGMFRLERASHDGLSLVPLGLLAREYPRAKRESWADDSLAMAA